MPTFGWVTKRETVTVAVFFMKPTLVTRPVNAMGGMVARRAEEEEGKGGSSLRTSTLHQTLGRLSEVKRWVTITVCPTGTGL